MKNLWPIHLDLWKNKPTKSRRQNDFPLPLSKQAGTKHTMIWEKKSNESTNTTSLESDLSNLTRQNSVCEGRVAPLNYKRRSRSPNYGNATTKNIKTGHKLNRKYMYEKEQIDICDQRRNNHLPPKPSVNKVQNEKSWGDSNRSYHVSKAPVNTLKRTLNSNQRIKKSVLQSSDFSLGKIETNNVILKSPVWTPFSCISNKNEPKRFRKEKIWGMNKYTKVSFHNSHNYLF